MCLPSVVTSNTKGHSFLFTILIPFNEKFEASRVFGKHFLAVVWRADSVGVLKQKTNT